MVATLIDVAAGRLAVKYAKTGAGVGTADMSIHFVAPVVAAPRATATLTFAVMEGREPVQSATAP